MVTLYGKGLQKNGLTTRVVKGLMERMLSNR